MKMRLAWYGGASTALAAVVIASAFHHRANFYSAMVHLSQSSLSLMILVNFIFLIYGSLMYGLQRLCFGQLRPVEIEQLYEKAWFAVTETCLAMTIFREELGAFFLVMFTALVTGKVWGWIGEGRVEILEQQPPANPRVFHTRLSISLLLSILYDCWLLKNVVNTVVQQARPTMMVMFLFEFTLLTISSFQTALRYAISLVEARIVKVQTAKRLEERRRQIREQRTDILARREREGSAEGEDQAPEPLPSEDDIDEMDIEVPGWESKGQWVLGLDLLADFLKLGIYSTFFCVLFTFYGLPIHIMRDLFLTTRSFVKRLGALLRYRQAIRDMNRYPDATQEELTREDTCIICREEMRLWDPTNPDQVERHRPKKLPCGHILHFGCLKSWLERQQVCPTCRRSVVMDNPALARNGEGMVFRLGFNFPNAQNQQPAANGPAPGGHQAGGDPQDAQQNGRGAGVRMFNLGPLRLGFAQGGVRDIQEMAERLGIPADVAEPQGGNQTPAAEDRNASTDVVLESISAQLSAVGQRVVEVGQRVQQDLQSLHNAEAQLQTLNLLLQETARLGQIERQSQSSVPSGETASSAGPVPPPQPLPHLQQQHPVFPPTFAQLAGHLAPLPQMPPYAPITARFSAPNVTRHTGAGYATAIPAGSPDLPEGVVIPPGWSLLPLQRLDGPATPAGPVPANHSQNPSHVPNQVPNHLADISEILTPQTHGVQNNLTSPARGPGGGHANTAPSIRGPEEALHAVVTQQPAAGGLSTLDEAHASQTESLPVSAPNPRVPNWWNGSAQLAGGTAPAPFGYQPRPASSTSNHQEQGAENSSGIDAAGGSGSSSTEDKSPSRKGKARVVTVEEASDDEEE